MKTANGSPDFSPHKSLKMNQSVAVPSSAKALSNPSDESASIQSSTVASQSIQSSLKLKPSNSMAYQPLSATLAATTQTLPTLMPSSTTSPTSGIGTLTWLGWLSYFLMTCIYYLLKVSYILLKIPLALVTYTTLQLTLTFDTLSLSIILLVTSVSLYILFRYRLLNPYARLPATVQNARAAPFDLHPDATQEDKTDHYPDEFMQAFLSSIKVFGYLDKRVFHELARNLQTKKLKAGEILFRSGTDNQDFYVVVSD